MIDLGCENTCWCSSFYWVKSIQHPIVPSIFQLSINHTDKNKRNKHFFLHRKMLSFPPTGKPPILHFEMKHNHHEIVPTLLTTSKNKLILKWSNYIKTPKPVLTFCQSTYAPHSQKHLKNHPLTIRFLNAIKKNEYLMADTLIRLMAGIIFPTLKSNGCCH